MLDKFWVVRSVQSWLSTGLVNFSVIAAVGTAEGVSVVQAHRIKPKVMVGHICPTLNSPQFESQVNNWEELIELWGKESQNNDFVLGFRDTAAMILFNYKIPNNSPGLLWQTRTGFKPLYVGSAPAELRELFWTKPLDVILGERADERDISFDADSGLDERTILLVLLEIRGVWKSWTARMLAERLGIPEFDVESALLGAQERGYLNAEGRLTDLGYGELDSSGIDRERKITVATNAEPYYPKALRVPKVPSSVCRLRERS